MTTKEAEGKIIELAASDLGSYEEIVEARRRSIDLAWIATQDGHKLTQQAARALARIKQAYECR